MRAEGCRLHTMAHAVERIIDEISGEVVKAKPCDFGGPIRLGVDQSTAPALSCEEHANASDAISVQMVVQMSERQVLWLNRYAELFAGFSDSSSRETFTCVQLASREVPPSVGKTCVFAFSKQDASVGDQEQMHTNTVSAFFVNHENSQSS